MHGEADNGGGELFSATDVARLSDGACGVGKYVVVPGGTRGRIVGQSSTEGWWLVRVESRGGPLREYRGDVLQIRS